MFRGRGDGRDLHGQVVLPPIQWCESPNQSQRLVPVTAVVVHDAEGAYSGAVSWLCNPQAQASAHVVLREDGLEATQLVPYSHKAWHCAATTTISVITPPPLPGTRRTSRPASA